MHTFKQCWSDWSYVSVANRQAPRVTHRHTLTEAHTYIKTRLRWPELCLIGKQAGTEDLSLVSLCL